MTAKALPRQKVLLVDRGVPKNLVYSRATAKKMKTKPTGHGFSLPNDYGEAPMNLVFAGGDKSVDEMVRSTERGILVTRLWYIREVDPYEKVLTGMTRDGTFLVENGKVAGGIRNFRFNQSILEMLSNVEMLGPAVRAAGEESFEMVVPRDEGPQFPFQRSHEILERKMTERSSEHRRRKRRSYSLRLAALLRMKNCGLSMSAGTATSKNPTIISSYVCSPQ